MKKSFILNSVDTLILTKEQEKRLSDRHAMLKRLIAELNRRINNDMSFRTKMISSGEWSKWLVEAIKERDSMILEYNEIAKIMTAHIDAKHAKGKTRHDIANGNMIYQVMMKAKATIENLMEQCGDNWTDDIRQLCGDLRNFGREASMLVKPDTIDKIKDDHTRELNRAMQEKNVMIANLNSQIRDLQSFHNRSRIILRRLYDARYTEVDEFRTARGITHRIHLTADDCNEIEQAIN